MLTKGGPEREDYCLFSNCVRQAQWSGLRLPLWGELEAVSLSTPLPS
jgi:hypothetical protein